LLLTSVAQTNMLDLLIIYRWRYNHIMMWVKSITCSSLICICTRSSEITKDLQMYNKTPYNCRAVISIHYSTIYYILTFIYVYYTLSRNTCNKWCCIKYKLPIRLLNDYSSLLLMSTDTAMYIKLHCHVWQVVLW